MADEYDYEYWGQPRAPLPGGLISEALDAAINKLKTPVDIVSDFLPVVGDVKSAGLAIDDILDEEYGSAALNAIGLLPFVGTIGDIPKVGRTLFMKTPKVQEALEDTMRAAEVANESDIATKVFDLLRSDVSKKHNGAIGEIVEFPQRIEYRSYTELADDLLSTGEYSMQDLVSQGINSPADFARRLEENGAPLVYHERRPWTIDRMRERDSAKLGRAPSITDEFPIENGAIVLRDAGTPNERAVFVYDGKEYGPNDIIPGTATDDPSCGGFFSSPDRTALQFASSKLPFMAYQYEDAYPIFRLWSKGK